MYQLVIDKYDVELHDREKFGSSITYAIADMLQLNVNKGATSKTIKVPATRLNKIFFGTPENFNSVAKITQSTKPNTTIFRSGTPILRGFTKISATTVDGVITEYSIVVKGDNGDWRQRIKGKKVNELDYSDQDHTLDFATVLASETLTTGREYVYDFIDRGKFEGSQIGGYDVQDVNGNVLYTLSEGVTINDRYPAIRVPGMIERIFKSVGYKVESNWLNSSHVQKLVLPFINERFRQPESFNDQQKMHVTSINNAFWLNVNTIAPGNIATPSVGPLIAFLQTDSDPGGNVVTNNREYLVPSDGQYKFKASISIAPQQYVQGTTGTVYVTIRKSSTGTILAQGTCPFPANQTVVVETALTSFIHGERIGVSTEMIIDAASTGFTRIAVLAGSTFECTEVAGVLSVQAGQSVSMNANLPEYTQLELLQGLAHIPKLLFMTDVEARKVYIEPWEDFFRTTVKPEYNWTNLLDKKKPFGTKFIGDQRGKVIKYRYKPDSNDKFIAAWEEQNQTSFASSEENNANLFAKDETEINQNPLFAATWMDFCETIGFRTVRIPRMWNDVVRPAKSTKFEPRILVYQGVKNMPGDEQWGQHGTTVTMRATYPSFEFYNLEEQNEDNLRFDDCDLSSGMFQKNWRNFHKTVTEGIAFYGSFKLTDTLISKFDFREPVYLEVNQTGAYFIVNEIKNYKPDVSDSTEVELLKIQGKQPRVMLRKVSNPFATSTVQQGPQSASSIDVVTVVPVYSRDGVPNESYQSFRYQGVEIFRIQDDQVRTSGGNVYVEISGVVQQVFFEDANGNVQPVTKD